MHHGGCSEGDEWGFCHYEGGGRVGIAFCARDYWRILSRVATGVAREGKVPDGGERGRSKRAANVGSAIWGRLLWSEVDVQLPEPRMSPEML